jgi:hypothetical protein
VYDTTASANILNITLSSSLGYSVSGSINVSASHILQVKTTNTPSCSTFPQIAEFAVTYQMQ